MRKSLGEKKRSTKKSQVSSESKDKKSTLIKSQSDIEKELDIPSYEEYKIKETDSIMEYDDEDVETKMIRLIFLKKKGENMKDKINIKKKKIHKTSGNLSKYQKLKIACTTLEKLKLRRKETIFFNFLKRKKHNSLILKIAANFIYKIKKYIMKTYVKNIYYFIFPINKSDKVRDSLISKFKNINTMLLSPQVSNKKLKKCMFPNKMLKLELMTKKSQLKKKGGADIILEKIKTKNEKKNFLDIKMKKLEYIEKREREYISKLKRRKKKIKKEIEIYKMNNNISEGALSQIKKKNDISEGGSDFFSNDNSNKLGSFHFDSTIKTEDNEDIFKIPRKKKKEKTLKALKFSEIIKPKNEDKKEKEIEQLISINSKRLNASDNEKNDYFKRNSVKNIKSNKKLRETNSKQLKVSMRLSGIYSRNKFKKAINSPNPRELEQKTNRPVNKVNISLNDSEDLFRQESNKEEKSKTIIKQKQEEEDEEKWLDEEEGGEISDTDEDFIQVPENRIENEDNQDEIEKGKINLVEYDTFYKEQFFKDELFKYDAENLKDKEYEKIQKEINKLEVKRKLKEKRILKEVNEIKGINTAQLKNEIEVLDEKYKDMKKETQKQIELNLDTTEQFVNKGRILNCYFKNKKEKNFPTFSIESEEELGAQEIIDFKPLRQEELSRRYYDHCCCFKQRKKIHDFRLAMRYSCKFYVDNWIFENVSTFITLVNCFLFFFSDPSNPNDIWNKVDNFFLIFYILEAGLKINTFSFYSAENAYIKDYWNILDLLVVMMGIISFICEKTVGNEKRKISGFNGLKAFRILKPLKTMKRFKNLKKLFRALIASISRLWEILIVLFAFFLFFAVAGLQMWQGFFLRRCMSVNYGYLVIDSRNKYLCTYDSDCANLNTFGNNYICAKGYINPNNGATNFDNIFNSLITVFLMVTLEGWANIFTYVSKTFKDKIYLNPIIIFVFFHVLIYIGAFYLINLFLAVTNSEFEHIEKSRKQLSEKKSFFGLIKNTFDPNEKKKKERKEAEKKLKLKNDKKSNEALKNLYFKIKDEAFHIHKNRRGVPKVYSTVKDIYIMANNNPEELYLEKQRIKDEEKALCEDVKKQQKEILLRLKQNKIEIDKSKIESKKINKTKTFNFPNMKEENKNFEKKLSNKFTLKSLLNMNTFINKGNENMEEQKENKIINNNLIKNISQNDLSTDLNKIISLKNSFNIRIIAMALENLDKYFPEKVNNIRKAFLKFQGEQKKKKKEKAEKEKIYNNQISFFEETKFEKRREELKNIKKESQLHVISRPRKQPNQKMVSGFAFSKYLDNNDTKQLNRQLSCVDDLALSSLSENSENNVPLNRKKKLNKRFTHIHPENIKLTKLIINDFKNQNENLSFDNDLFNNSIFMNTKRKSVNLKDTSIENITNMIERGDNNIDSIINTKQLMLFDNLNVKSKFRRPHSTLNYIIKLEDEQKFKGDNIRFNLQKYLKKEAEKDQEFLNKDRRNSFLGFLEYTQYQKEQRKLEDLIEKDKDKISFHSGSINEDSSFKDNSFNFLSEESFLSRNNSISVDDIDLLSGNIREKEIYKNEYVLRENLKKNLDSNKLTQNIRAEVFDRETVNINVNLTTNELKKYYEEVNKKLDEQLYVNKKSIRIRDYNTNCNMSRIIKYNDYNKNLKSIRRDNENENSDDSEEEAEKNNNMKVINIKTNENNNNDINKINYNNIKSAEFTKNIDLKSPRKKNDAEKENKLNMLPLKIASSKKLLSNNLKEDEKNSAFPLLTNQKTLNALNLKIRSKILGTKENDKKIINNNYNVSNKSIMNKSIKNNSIKVEVNNKAKNANPSSNKSLTSKVKDNFFIFKAKSIDKNIKKYPIENSKTYIVNEENKENKDLLTTQQELIPINLRGKKYYMNYLYNIMDIDLKVKDNFTVNHWKDEIYGIKKRFFKMVSLPPRTDAFFVFNDKNLKLKKYKYIYYTDYKFKKNELSYLTTKLKYLPLNVLVLMPKRLRNFGKYASKQNMNLLMLNDHINISQSKQSYEKIGKSPLNFFPNSVFLSTIGYTNQPTEIVRSNTKYTTSKKNTSKGNLTMSSAYSKNYVIQKEISFKKEIFDKMYKKLKEFNYLALSHYFLNEDKLLLKFMDSKRQEELVNTNKEKNRKKYNRMKIKNEVDNILLYDYKTNSHIYVKWSGEDVLYKKDVEQNRKRWNKLIKSLENFNMIIWHQNAYVKRIQKIRYAFYVFANNDYFEYTILSIVIINSFYLAFEGNLFIPEFLSSIKILNFIFNIIFIFEYVVKFIGLTPLVYYSDPFSYLDTAIIIFSLVDIVAPEENSDIFETKKSISSQLAFLRVFRIFRVIRIAKVLRKLKSMRIIIVSIKKSLKNVAYIIIILILFIFIFQLLGMSLLYQNYHFKSFLVSFYSTYQILTLENWDTIFYEIWPINKFCIFYFVFWIFIGNYILFNLFISILIQSFSDMDMEDEDDLTEDDIIERIYPLPDYLFTLKNNITDYNYVKIHELRRASKEPMYNNIFSSGTISTSKEGMNKYSSSNFNLANISKLSIDTESEENLEKTDFSKTTEFKDEVEDVDEDNKMYTLIEKRMIKWQKINKIFKKNECEDSLYLFSQSNGFRILCMKLINHSLFDKFILFIIILSTLRLIMDTFLGGYSIAFFFDICDLIFNIIFLLEAVIKMIALGLAFDEGSYLRDNWNKMDAIIVICSFIEFHTFSQKYIFSQSYISSFEFLKIMRLLRTLRPLRFISHNDNLKLIVTSLFDSALPIFNTLFILIVVLFMFSIVGISLFYSYFHNCYLLQDNGSFILPQDSFNAELLAKNNVTNDMPSISDFCARRYNGIMDTGPTFKFSNIIDAFITSYVLSTMEGWPEIMSNYRIYENSYGIFFVVFNLIVAYFFLNLFTGIMFKYFNEAYKRELKLDSDDKKTSKYYDFLTQIFSARSDYIIWKKPSKGTIKYYLREFVDSEYFENVMLGIIFFNFLILCQSYEDSPKNYIDALRIINKIITVLFTIELFFKLCAYGLKSYFYLYWNIFDFILVVISYIDWKFEEIEGIDSSFLRTFQLIRVLRVLRVSRVLRLIKALKGLEKLIQTLQWSISALSNVLFLTLVIYGTIALMGCYLYEGDKSVIKIRNSYYINDYFNFDNFYKSYLLIFRCSTGENWHNIMEEYAYINDADMGYSFGFFILDNFITSVILLNLLLMVTLHQYDEFTDKDYNPIDKFNSFIKDFNNAWNKFSTEDDEGYRIKKFLAAKFLIELNIQKFFLPEKNKLEYAKKYVCDLKLYYDKEDYVYYHDVIFKILYKLYGTKIDRDNPENNLIFKTEKKILKKIRDNINKYVQKKRGRFFSKNNEKNVLITFNPLNSHLYYKYSFIYMKAFINFYKDNEQFVQHLKDENKKMNSQFDSSNISGSSDNNLEKDNNFNNEEDENEEEEEEEDDNENEEGESLNEEESSQKEHSISYNVPDNNLIQIYKNNEENNNQNNNNNSENISNKDLNDK